MAEKKEPLFDQFPGISYDEWRAKVEADLKGADFNKKLVWRTNEGFNVQPIYRAEDIADLKTTNSLPGEYPYVRGTRTDNDWLTRQEICATTPEEANATAIDVLGKGVTSLGFKVKDPSRAVVEALLKGIDLGAVEINFTCCPSKALELTRVVVGYILDNNAADTFRGSVSYNPFRRVFRHGAKIDKDAMVAEAKELLSVASPVKNLRVLSVDLSLIHI